MAQWVMQELTELNSVASILKFLNGVAIKQIELISHPRTDFLKPISLLLYMYLLPSNIWTLTVP
jgi:hypothetical protein